MAVIIVPSTLFPTAANLQNQTDSSRRQSISWAFRSRDIIFSLSSANKPRRNRACGCCARKWAATDLGRGESVGQNRELTGNGRVRQVGFEEVLIFFLRYDRKQHYWGQRSYLSLLAETRATLTDESSTDSVHFAVLCQLDSLLNNAFGTMGSVSSGLGS